MGDSSAPIVVRGDEMSGTNSSGSVALRAEKIFMNKTGCRLRRTKRNICMHVKSFVNVLKILSAHCVKEEGERKEKLHI
jgi:hypothetical protein